MKTEQRKKIDDQKNDDLPALLHQLLPYWRAIAGLLLVALAAIVVTGLIRSGRKGAQEEGWASYLNAAANRDSTGFQQLADESSGSVAPWAQQSAAQAKLIEASAAVYTDRATAKRTFEEAAEGFKKAMAEAGDIDLIQQRALWGLGQSYEGLNELSKAKEYYQRLVDEWPDASIAKQAQLRITSLNDPASQGFYTWFFDQTPPATQLPATGDVPGLPFEVPSNPDVTVPDMSDLAPATEAESPDVPATEEGSTDEGSSTADDEGNSSEAASSEE